MAPSVMLWPFVVSTQYMLIHTYSLSGWALDRITRVDVLSVLLDPKQKCRIFSIRSNVCSFLKEGGQRNSIILMMKWDNEKQYSIIASTKDYLEKAPGNCLWKYRLQLKRQSIVGPTSHGELQTWKSWSAEGVVRSDGQSRSWGGYCRSRGKVTKSGGRGVLSIPESYAAWSLEKQILVEDNQGQKIFKLEESEGKSNWKSWRVFLRSSAPKGVQPKN